MVNMPSSDNLGQPPGLIVVDSMNWSHDADVMQIKQYLIVEGREKHGLEFAAVDIRVIQPVVCYCT